MVEVAQLAQVKDVMTRQVLSVSVNDTLELIAQLFEKYDYDGIPVIGEGGRLLGLITSYDMVLQSTGMHLPTVLNIMNKIAVNKADQKELTEHFNKLKQINAKQIMNPKPMIVAPDITLDVAADMFARHHRVNPLLVVDQGILVGVLSRYDVIRFFNEKYFQQVVQAATEYQDPYKELATTNSEREIESAMGEATKELMLVTKKRPLIWHYAAVAAFIAGLVAATAMIIRVVRKG